MATQQEGSDALYDQLLLKPLPNVIAVVRAGAAVIRPKCRAETPVVYELQVEAWGSGGRTLEYRFLEGRHWECGLIEGRQCTGEGALFRRGGLYRSRRMGFLSL